MRHNKKVLKLGRNKAARKSLLKNLAAQLILYEAINTTEAKAKALKQVVEPLITKAKNDTLANRRNVIAFLPVKNATKKLFEVLAPRYKDRKGGYCRVIKTGQRSGDGASRAKIELV